MWWTVHGPWLTAPPLCSHPGPVWEPGSLQRPGRGLPAPPPLRTGPFARIVQLESFGCTMNEKSRFGQRGLPRTEGPARMVPFAGAPRASRRSHTCSSEFTSGRWSDRSAAAMAPSRPRPAALIWNRHCEVGLPLVLGLPANHVRQLLPPSPVGSTGSRVLCLRPACRSSPQMHAASRRKPQSLTQGHCRPQGHSSLSKNPTPPGPVSSGCPSTSGFPHVVVPCSHLAGLPLLGKSRAFWTISCRPVLSLTQPWHGHLWASVNLPCFPPHTRKITGKGP